MDIRYQWSDAWILLATIYAAKKQPAMLPDVIAAADHIRQAIVTFEAMEGALARLTAGGFLVDSGGKLSPSPKTLEFYRSVAMPQRSVFEEEEDIQRLLGVSSWSPFIKPQDANRGISYPLLTRERFDRAVDDYLSRFSELTGADPLVA